MPFIKVYIHFVWCTKNREPFLDSKQKRITVWKHIKENAIAKGIVIDHISGYSEHCHCLVSLKSDQSLKQVMHLIKGESSFWINRQGLTATKFEWQNDYYAVSVSESAIGRVRSYIRKQEEKHAIQSFVKENDEFIIEHGFVRFTDN